MFYAFPDNYSFSFRVLRAIANIAFGQGEFGEIYQVIQKVKSDDWESWCKEWNAMGDHCVDIAKQAEAKGHIYTATQAYRRANNYFHCSQFFLEPDDKRKLPIYMKSLECFDKGVILDHPGPERVHIPYEDSFLYAYFLPTAVPAEDGPSPCMVWFGGLDSTAEEVYFAIATDLSKRGMNVLIVDGPGQGASLRLNHVRSRYDYEAAGTAAFNYLLTRSDVDHQRIGVMAWSLGGYYAPRVAAFEPRFSALVTYGAIYDYGEVWRNRPDDHPLVKYGKWILDIDSVEEMRAEFDKFSFKGGILSQVKCPALIMHGGHDQQQNSLEGAQKLFNDLVNSSHPTFKVFTEEEGGCEHVQADNQTIANAYVGDWLREIFHIK